ncbi:MAG: hypothetical protein U0176_14260 [Bacteroidia bacterium]
MWHPLINALIGKEPIQPITMPALPAKIAIVMTAVSALTILTAHLSKWLETFKAQRQIRPLTQNRPNCPPPKRQPKPKAQNGPPR